MIDNILNLRYIHVLTNDEFIYSGIFLSNPKLRFTLNELDSKYHQLCFHVDKRKELEEEEDDDDINTVINRNNTKSNRFDNNRGGSNFCTKCLNCFEEEVSVYTLEFDEKIQNKKIIKILIDNNYIQSLCDNNCHILRLDIIKEILENSCIYICFYLFIFIVVISRLRTEYLQNKNITYISLFGNLILENPLILNTYDLYLSHDDNLVYNCITSYHEVTLTNDLFDYEEIYIIFQYIKLINNIIFNGVIDESIELLLDYLAKWEVRNSINTLIIQNKRFFKGDTLFVLMDSLKELHIINTCIDMSENTTFFTNFSLGSLYNLETLVFRSVRYFTLYNDFVKIGKSFKNLTKLKNLSLVDCFNDETVFAHIYYHVSHISTLEFLDISNNTISDKFLHKIMDDLTSFHKLKICI